MGHDPTQAIAKWFADHSGDGEFMCEGRSLAYLVIGPSDRGAPIVYATKPSTVASAIGDRSRISMIGRRGLPDATDVTWIHRVIGEFDVMFLGDMDPADLMIFSWLRTSLYPKEVQYLGISDSYLDELKIVLPESFILRCSPSERKSLPVLNKALPDLKQLVGPKCADLIQQGRKIELEAVVSAMTSTSSILQPAILSKK